MNKNIVWLTQGSILNNELFQKEINNLVQICKKEKGTNIFWWSKQTDVNRFIEIELHDNEQSVIEHLNNWRPHQAAIQQVATIDHFTIHGTMSDQLKGMLANHNPTYMDFFGGFNKLSSNINEPDNSNIIWTMQGDITNFVAFNKAKEILTSEAETELGTLTYWWSITPNQKEFHILTRFSDTNQAMKHLENWNQLSDDFRKSIHLNGFKVFSTINELLSVAIAAFSPIRLDFIDGFAR